MRRVLVDPHVQEPGGQAAKQRSRALVVDDPVVPREEEQDGRAELADPLLDHPAERATRAEEARRRALQTQGIVPDELQEARRAREHLRLDGNLEARSRIEGQTEDETQLLRPREIDARDQAGGHEHERAHALRSIECRGEGESPAPREAHEDDALQADVIAKAPHVLEEHRRRCGVSRLDEGVQPRAATIEQISRASAQSGPSAAARNQAP
jgi:hypothetical protein